VLAWKLTPTSRSWMRPSLVTMNEVLPPTRSRPLAGRVPPSRRKEAQTQTPAAPWWWADVRSAFSSLCREMLCVAPCTYIIRFLGAVVKHFVDLILPACPDRVLFGDGRNFQDRVERTRWVKRSDTTITPDPASSDAGRRIRPGQSTAAKVPSSRPGERRSPAARHHR
jgi:hypothetical protein